MAYVHEIAALRILEWLHETEKDLLSTMVELVSGEIGIVRHIKPDPDHGLMFSLDTHPNWRPISQIKRKTSAIGSCAMGQGLRSDAH